MMWRKKSISDTGELPPVPPIEDAKQALKGAHEALELSRELTAEAQEVKDLFVNAILQAIARKGD